LLWAKGVFIGNEDLIAAPAGLRIEADDTQVARVDVRH